MNQTPIAQTSGKLPVTALILCGNEEHNIAACLESVAWADEVFVVIDASSIDRTEEIARGYTDRILRHHYENYATQQNWAIPQAKHEWVLVVDADERVTSALHDEISALFKKGLDQDGYWMTRANFLFGKEVHFSGWGGEKVLRLFRRDIARYQQKRVHAKAEIKKTGELRGRLDHYSITSVQNWVAKINRYSSWKSQDKFEKRSRFPHLQLVVRPFYRFFKDFVLRLGVLDGSRGFLISMLSAFAEFVMAAKLIEHYWKHKEALRSASDVDSKR